MLPKRLLIANRGEVAVRVARTAAELGIETVAVYADDESDAMHVRHADSCASLAAKGVAAYLQSQKLVEIAASHACDAIHPGWGFLSEVSAFAGTCEQRGVLFIGPTAAQLEQVGSKLAARALAQAHNVPVLPGSNALAEAEDFASFASAHAGSSFMLKASAGGGGRGMRVVMPHEDGRDAFAQAQGEAQLAFADGTLFAERYIERARHIEVQVLGDGHGGVTHFWERDCSLQRRRQKLIEIAPAPSLDADLRDDIIAAALTMARAVNYRGLGTFEFLVDDEEDAYFFIEANPRLQVEHPVTEAVCDVDLLALQIHTAAGATLADLGINDPAEPKGFAIQVRVNAEQVAADLSPRPGDGVITRFDLPTGPGIRVDTAVRNGANVSSRYDSLIAKLIVHSRVAGFPEAINKTIRAVNECAIAGVATNLPLANAILAMPEVKLGSWHTTFVETHADTLRAAIAMLPIAQHETPTAPTTAASSTITLPTGTIPVETPMRGSVVSIDVTVGELVHKGQTLATLEAMKMHHLIEAPASGEVALIYAEPGATLDESAPMLAIYPGEADEDEGGATHIVDLDAARADLDEVNARHALGLDENRPDAVAKRRKIGGRTARENVADLMDQGSFLEYGALTIAAQRRRRDVADLMERTPADGMIAGIGTVNAADFGDEAARCAVLAYDYTVLAGTQGNNNHKKKDRMFELAERWKIPTVFFTEGGGGRPGDVDTDDLIMSWLDLKTFTTWPKLSGVAPRIAINSGRCFAGNAVIFGCADITIATENSNIGLAGPAMIEGGGLGKFTPEDIGPIDVQTLNGVVDIAVKDEAEATAVARNVLGCFQGRKPTWGCVDQRELRHLIPEDRLRIYDPRKIVHALADTGSVIELRPEYGVGIITAFVRIEGHPFGLIANDPRHLGGAIDGDGGEKGGRFLQLCDAYGLPVISLVDTPGYMVGPDSEKTAAVRRGSRLIIASANLSVPLFTIVLRKAYGLGGQAMAGGGLHEPFYTIAWPTAEFGPMGLEGAVELGFSKELAAAPDAETRKTLYDDLVAKMYAKGKGVSVAQVYEIDAVIDPRDTRAWIVGGLKAAGPVTGSPRRYVDVW